MQIYGSMEVKKVTGNLHIVRTCLCRLRRPLTLPLVQTTLGHGYLSWEHTDHARAFTLHRSRACLADIKATVMNLSHVIHEFSFGPYFPRIVQPLDNSV